MAYSNSISSTTFSANRVVDTAFRRCRLPAQAITSEMQQYALDALYLLLSEMANTRAPSWCVESILLPMYETQPIVDLPTGTVDVLNANYRTMSLLSGTETVAAQSVEVEFDETTAVSTVGIYWNTGTPVNLTAQVSDDGIAWTTVATIVADGGSRQWTDIVRPEVHFYFRVTAIVSIDIELWLMNNPSEVPLGQINRDIYTASTSSITTGRPTIYWFQRDLPVPVMNMWPAPNITAAEQALIRVWRQRHIMDTQNLRQDVEVPQRWMDAIIAKLAFKLAEETPAVDLQLVPMLEVRAAALVQAAWDGDGDGSAWQISPWIAPYTR